MQRYIYANSSPSESTTDIVFSSYNAIYENGELIKESNRFLFENTVCSGLIDIEYLNTSRINNITFRDSFKYYKRDIKIINIPFDDISYGEFDKKIKLNPFIYENHEKNKELFEEIFIMQKCSLEKRLSHINSYKIILGISGG